MKSNRVLMVAAAALFLLSFLSYRESVNRAERFERGQKFLSNLNPDEIANIFLSKDGETTELRRQGDAFTVASAHGYPAANDSVNRLLKDILGLSLEKEVGSGERLEEELGLRADAAGTLEVVLQDDAGKEMVRFLVGNAFEEGSGNYVQRLDGDKSPVFLTSERVYLETEGGDFLKQELLDVAASDIASIRGSGFVFEDVDGALTLSGLAPGKKESAKATQLKGVLSGLRFDEHFLANDPSLQPMVFDHELEVNLKDQSGYLLMVAEKGDDHYLRVAGVHDVGQVSVALDASEDEVRETSEMLTRADEIKEFNALHGSFIYRVSKITADKVRSKASELVEDA